LGGDIKPTTKININLSSDGKTRVVIEKNKPELNALQYVTKTIVGQKISISDDILINGNDYLYQRLLSKYQKGQNCNETPIFGQVNNILSGQLLVEKIGFYNFTIEA
jgi:starch synthase (maltosyl-transferring)